MTATLTVDLDSYTGTDAYGGTPAALTLYPMTTPYAAGGKVHVGVVQIVLDAEGKGSTTLIAGVVYRVALSGATLYIGPLTDGQTIDLSDPSIISNTPPSLPGGSGGMDALTVVSGGTVDLPNSTPVGGLLGYRVTATTTIEGVSVDPGGYIFERTTSGWAQYTLPAGAAIGASTPAEPTAVTASVPVADDDANTWTWTPQAGVEYLVDGTVQAGTPGAGGTVTFNVGDVAKSSTITAQALAGYYLTSGVSVTFLFTSTTSGSVPTIAAYKTAVQADSPRRFFPLDDASGTSSPANLGSVTADTATIAGGTPANFVLGAGSLWASPSTNADINGQARLDVSGSVSAAAFTQEMVLILDVDGSHAMPYKPFGTSAGTCYVSAYGELKFDGFVYAPGVGSTVDLSSPTGAVAFNVRQHIAVTYDGTALRLYVNGSEVASNTSVVFNNTYPTNRNNLRICGDGGNYPGFWGAAAGYADYGSALTAARILAHAQAAGCA